MFTEYYDQLTETHKGILLMLAGLLLLAYKLGFVFLEGLNSIISLAVYAIAISLMVYGFYKLDGPKKIKAFFNKKS